MVHDTNYGETLRAILTNNFSKISSIRWVVALMIPLLIGSTGQGWAVSEDDQNNFLENACAPGKLVLVHRHRSRALQADQAALRSPEHPTSDTLAKLVVLSERIASKKTAAFCSSKENGCRKVLRQAKRRNPLTFRRAHRFSCSSDYLYSVDATPNDPYYYLQYGFEQFNDADIDAAEGWDRSTGGTPVVGIVDTGIDYNHEDLKNNMWVNPGEVAGNGIDDDKNGVVDDVYGYNGISGSKKPGDPLDDHYHGTHCAGTIGAEGNNGIGVAGVAWQTKMMALKFLSSKGSGSTSDAIKVLIYALDQKKRGVNLVALNNSWGGGGYSASLHQVIKDLEQAGVVFVVAAGNAATNNDLKPTYPANYSVANVITVAAVDATATLASFSNYGPNTVHIAAPGQSIVSAYPGNKYAYLSGTSMAAPHVTGAIALAAAYQSVSSAKLISAVLDTAQQRDSLLALVQKGRFLNVANTLDALAPVDVPVSEPGSAEGTPTPAPSTPPVEAEPTIAPTPEPTATAVPTPTVKPNLKQKKKAPPKAKKPKKKKKARKARK